jgi:phage/plasmid-associated DNA primase
MELSGALNKAIDGLERVRKCFRFTESRDSRAALKRYQAANDLLAAWLDEYTVEAPDAVVPQSDLHRANSSHCQQSSRRPASKQAFSPGYEHCDRVSSRVSGW